MVSYDDVYHNVIANQLGNVIVCRDIDSANRISRKMNNRYRVVTLEGEVINIGGSITGGSIKTTHSIISDKRDLELYRLKRDEVTSLIAELDKQIKESEELVHAKEDDIYKEKANLVAIEEKIHINKNEINLLSDELSKVKSELNSLGHVVDESLSKEEDRIMKLFYEVARDKEEVQKNIVVKTKEKDKTRA